MKIRVGQPHTRLRRKAKGKRQMAKGKRGGFDAAREELGG